MISTLSRNLGAPIQYVAFIPTVDEIYPPGFDDWVEVKARSPNASKAPIAPATSAASPPSVARLFRIIRPHRAYFGQKDAQQLRVIRRMVEEQQSAGRNRPDAHRPRARRPRHVQPQRLPLAEERAAALAIPSALASPAAS